MKQPLNLKDSKEHILDYKFYECEGHLIMVHKKTGKKYRLEEI